MTKEGNGRPVRYPVRLYVRIDQETQARLEKVREDRGMEDVSSLLRVIFKDWLRENDK